MKPMKQWLEIPTVFRKNIAFTCAAAISSLLITVIVFFTTDDHNLLCLGLVCFLLGISKTLGFMRTVLTGSYETVVGICGSIDSPVFSRNVRIHITLTNGIALTLPMNLRHRFQTDHTYCLYFRKGTPIEESSSVWLQRVQADGLMAYEEFDTEKLTQVRLHMHNNSEKEATNVQTPNHRAVQDIPVYKESF